MTLTGKSASMFIQPRRKNLQTSIIVWAFILAWLPTLSAAARQHERAPGEKISFGSRLEANLLDYSIERRASIQGNQRDRIEDLGDAEGNWLQQMVTAFNSSAAPIKKSHSLKSDSDPDSQEESGISSNHSRGSHPKVGTLNDLEMFEPWYWTIEYGYAWIAGYRPYLYWANTTNCFNRMSNFTYLEIPEFERLIRRPRLSVYDGMLNTTYMIQNLTVHLWYCNSAFTTASRYWDARISEYNGNIGMFFLSMLQNLLARIISMTNLYKSITANLEVNNSTGVNYDTARLIRILTMFEPIEPQDEDLDRVLIPTEEQSA